MEEITIKGQAAQLIRWILERKRLIFRTRDYVILCVPRDEYDKHILKSLRDFNYELFDDGTLIAP